MGCVNIHASLLPRWRGAAPIQRAILAGDTISGVTIMQMDVGLDTGPMLLIRKLTVDRKNTGQVTEEMADLGAEALIEWLSDPTSYRPQPQPDDGATYAPKIDKGEARIDWKQPAEAIVRQVRAFAPAPGAWFEASGERIKLIDAVDGADANGTPGEVIDESLNIACGEGYVRPLRVQRAGKSAMTPGELLRGFPIPKGTILP
jgi:methionyl-tRNA formyltransferase